MNLGVQIEKILIKSFCCLYFGNIEIFFKGNYNLLKVIVVLVIIFDYRRGKIIYLLLIFIEYQLLGIDLIGYFKCINLINFYVNVIRNVLLFYFIDEMDEEIDVQRGEVICLKL